MSAGIRRHAVHVVGPMVLAALLVALLPLAGCVRRTVTINTEPQGAVVWLNDEEIGRSPATVDFLWYGDYSIVARMEGYETLDTHEKLTAPWYQWPGVDFFTESVYPGWIHDERAISLALTPAMERDRDQLLQDAAAFRERTLFSED